MTTSSPPPNGMRVFAWIWLGQVVSIFGSNLTNFALGVWVYKTTGSATQFALISFVMSVPGLLVSPLVGALVDRWDRRFSMIFGDGADTLTKVVLALLIWSGGLEVWHIYAILALSSFFHAFQVPAFSASTALLVPKRHLGRASGLVQAGTSGALILAPLSAGFLLDRIGFGGIIGIDLVTATLGILAVATVRIPKPETTEAPAGAGGLLRDATYGWSYLRERRGLPALLGLSAILNFSIGMVHVLLTPMLLSFASAADLGMVLSGASVGMLVGSIVMSTWGGPENRMAGVFGFVALQGGILMVGMMRPSVPLLAAAAFAFMFFTPLVLGCTRAIWQSKIAPGVQGRVFALTRMLALSCLPVASLIAGPL
ncbi:MAG: MFS transporter, partial [Acidobacteriota bacterium]